MMKSSAISLCALACFTALALPCAAQDNAQSNPWNGSWKMDRSSLQYDGPTVSVTTDPAGYTITRGDKTDPKVVCDGKPNPPADGTITTCTKTANGYLLQNTRPDKSTSKVKIETSPDGQTLTRTAEITPPDGSSPFTMTFVSKKVGGSGNTAQWKETSFNESQDTGVLSVQVNGDSVDFKESDSDKPVTCKLDGTPATLFGTRTMSCKLDDPHTLKVTYSNDGKVQRENTFILSADGSTITETDITPPPMTSKMEVTFHKS